MGFELFLIALVGGLFAIKIGEVAFGKTTFAEQNENWKKLSENVHNRTIENMMQEQNITRAEAEKRFDAQTDVLAMPGKVVVGTLVAGTGAYTKMMDETSKVTHHQ